MIDTTGNNPYGKGSGEVTRPTDEDKGSESSDTEDSEDLKAQEQAELDEEYE